MAHNTLENYFRTIFSLQKRGFAATFVEDLVIFERDVYVSLQAAENKK